MLDQLRKALAERAPNGEVEHHLVNGIQATVAAAIQR